MSAAQFLFHCLDGARVECDWHFTFFYVESIHQTVDKIWLMNRNSVNNSSQALHRIGLTCIDIKIKITINGARQCSEMLIIQQVLI